jgi:hypothetical protein
MGSMMRINIATWICLVFCTAVVSGGALRAAESASGDWIGTWTAVPQPYMPAALLTFRNQTVRLIAHSSIGGRSVPVTRLLLDAH